MTLPDSVPTGRAALLLGATGLVGGHCLEILLNDEGYSSVHLLVRSTLDREHPKLVQHVVDFDRLSDYAELFRVDDVFCCLGTTIRRAGSQEAFWRVDVHYPATAAGLAAEAGADQFIVVSALGADPDSRVFYNRCKGEMEAAVRRQPLQAVWIVRPALLLGSRQEARLGERLAEILLRPIAPLMVGPLRRYRPIHASAVAVAMVRLARQNGTGGVLESDEIAALASAGTIPS